MFLMKEPCVAGPEEPCELSVVHRRGGARAPLVAPRPPLPLSLRPGGRVGAAAAGPGAGWQRRGHVAAQHAAPPVRRRVSAPGGGRGQEGGIRAAGPAAGAQQPGQSSVAGAALTPLSPPVPWRPCRVRVWIGAPAAPGEMAGSAVWEDGEPSCGTWGFIQEELAGDAGQGKRGAVPRVPRGLFSGTSAGTSMCSGGRPALSISAWLRFLCHFSGFK